MTRRSADEPDQASIPAVWMRGGTSKAVFFQRTDLPADDDACDRLLKRVMGTPDCLQIDGLGGATLSTSKVAIVAPSARDDADVDYTFVQVEVVRDAVDRALNCGNISTAVGPYTVDEGWVEAIAPVTTVRIWNTNTQSLLVAKVPVRVGKAAVRGECAMAGVPGTGAEIVMDYANAVGARTGALLPTGQASDTIMMEDGRLLSVTFCDAANPCVFVAAESLGLTGTETPSRITGDAALMRTVHELRGKAGQRLGFWPDWSASGLPSMPMLVIVAPPAEHLLLDGTPQRAESMDLCARLIFLDQCHPSLAATGALCLAAAARIEGSVVREAVRPSDRSAAEIRIGHPTGVTPVKVLLDTPGESGQVRYAVLGFARTARRLMEGKVFVPNLLANNEEAYP